MKLNLSLQMFIATFLGIGIGLFLGDLCEVFAPFTKAYIMILKITAVPYLIVAIMRGVGQLLPKQSLTILKKGLLVIAGVWAINLILIFSTASAFPHARGPRIASYSSHESIPIDFASLLIPENIFNDLANNIIPSIVVFSLLVGIALMHHPSKAPILTALEYIQGILSKITTWISKITPIGTFFIIAQQFGTINLSTIQQISTYIILYDLCLVMTTFWLIPRLIATFTDTPYRVWLKTLGPILLLAYTTNFVIVCIPFIIEALERRLKEDYKVSDPQTLGEVQGLVSLVFNLPLGSLFISVFVLFLTVLFNAPLGVGSHINLFVTTFFTSLGAVGLGSWINCLSFLLDSLMLPKDSINLYLTSLPFTSGFQSMISVSEIAFIAYLVALLGIKAIRFRPMKLVQGAVMGVVPVFLFFQLIHTYNPFPPLISRTKSIYDLSIASSIPVIIAEKNPSNLKPRTLNEIKASKVLKVGYASKNAPFSFLNNYGELVGFDISYAYQLAYDLDCSLELVPLNYPDLTQELNTGAFDIGMSAISMNEERIESSYCSIPYLTSPIILLMHEEKKKIYKSSAYIFGDTSLRIGAMRGTSYAELLPKLFPDHPLVLLDSYENFDKNPRADVILWNEYEAIAWAVKHPMYRVMYPNPAIGMDTLCYMIRQGDNELLEYLNSWLTLKKNEGFFDLQFNLWVNGKTESIEPKERRWSLIRNYLHWVK